MWESGQNTLVELREYYSCEGGRLGQRQVSPRGKIGCLSIGGNVAGKGAYKVYVVYWYHDLASINGNSETVIKCERSVISPCQLLMVIVPGQIRSHK